MRAKTLHLTLEGRELAARLDHALDALRKDVLAKVGEQDGQAAVRALLALDAACTGGQIEPEPDHLSSGMAATEPS